MFDLHPGNAAAYLAQRHGLDPAALRVTPLGGGVSNTVLLVESPEGRFVLKQALGKLRVDEDWFSDRTRIYRECAVIRDLAPYLPPGSVPAVLFEDRDNCLFAMSAAAPGAQSWKSLLLEGAIDPSIAASIAAMLSAMIRVSWTARAWEETFGDQTVFDQLRLDPYYRFTASRHPDLADRFDSLIQNCRQRRYALVHGDWSPKNFLLDGASVMAIDFEVIHFGDPSFDAAFLLNHLLLKSFYRPQWRDQYREAALRFWQTLQARLPQPSGWFEPAAIGHLCGLLLARIDGKSPAEYIRSEDLKNRIRRFARNLILSPPPSLEDIFQ